MMRRDLHAPLRPIPERQPATQDSAVVQSGITDPDSYDEVFSGLSASMSQCNIPIGSTFQVVSQDSTTYRFVIGNPGGRSFSSL